MFTRRDARLIFYSLILCVGQLTIAHGQTQPAATTGAALPHPTAAVQDLLAESNHYAEANDLPDALKATDEALAAAVKGEDRVGQALLQQARAKILQDLARNDEAVAEWQLAANTWAALSYPPGQITCLVQAGLLYAPDKKEEAGKVFSQGLSIAKADTRYSDAIARALFDSGVLLAQGHYESGQRPIKDFVGSYARLVKNPTRQTAWDYLSAALAIQEKQSSGSMEVAKTLNSLAQVTDQLAYGSSEADFDKHLAMEKDYAARSVEIVRRLAPDSALLAECLHRLGNAESTQSDFTGNAQPALDHLLAALHRVQKLDPGGSMDEASILDDIGRLENRQTKTREAQEYLSQAVALGGKFAPESAEFAFSLGELGASEEDSGDFPEAREKLDRALAINEKNHISLGPTYVNLGVLTFYQSDFIAARGYLEKALELFQKSPVGAFGADIALANLGGVSFQLGDLSSALEYQKRALAIDESNWPTSISTSIPMDEIGNVLKEQGKYSEANEYYQKALAIQEKLLPDSLYVATTLGNLATLANAQNNTALAMDYDRRALEAGKKACPDSWCVVSVINDIAEVSYHQRDLVSSENYFRRAIEMRERNLGSTHPDLARSLNGLALTLAAEGKREDALADALRAESIGVEHLRVSARTLPERQALAYEGFRASGLDVALTLASESASTPSDRKQVLDAVIRSRALVFDELASRYRSVYGSGDPDILQLSERLSSTRTRLAALVLRGPGDSIESYRTLLDDARARKEEAERALAEKSAAFRNDLAKTQWGFKDVAAALPHDAALVAYVRFARHQFSTVGMDTETPKPTPSYAAFVLSSTDSGLQLVPLGPAGEIDRLLGIWRRNVLQRAEVTNGSNTAGEAVCRRAGTALRRKIWDPLAPFLANRKQVFVVPDGALHLVNIGALPVGSSSFVIETGPLIHYLSAERDLVPVPEHHGDGILVVGNPTFDHSNKPLMASAQNSALSTGNNSAENPLRGIRSACGAFQTLRFGPLPASQREADNVTALWNRFTRRELIFRGIASQQPSEQLLEITGQNATREMFEQNAPGKRVLHVATHGFFLEDSCESVVQRRLDKRNEDVLPAQAENPLLLSGLAFSGANRRSEAKTNESDGILTAEEIAGMNLDGVDWAVLSACNTGLGKIQVGEGVFGLQRAFQVAGAKTVIMSLWPVEDETARNWMTALYREHFSAGRNTAESVRAASLLILRQRRAKHLSTDPFYWGAFIAAGDGH